MHNEKKLQTLNEMWTLDALNALPCVSLNMKVIQYQG